MVHGGFPAERNKNPTACKLAQTFPALELRADILRTWRVFLSELPYETSHTPGMVFKSSYKPVSDFRGRDVGKQLAKALWCRANAWGWASYLTVLMFSLKSQPSHMVFMHRIGEDIWDSKARGKAFHLQCHVGPMQRPHAYFQRTQQPIRILLEYRIK